MTVFEIFFEVHQIGQQLPSISIEYANQLCAHIAEIKRDIENNSYGQSVIQQAQYDQAKKCIKDMNTLVEFNVLVWDQIDCYDEEVKNFYDQYQIEVVQNVNMALRGQKVFIGIHLQ